MKLNTKEHKFKDITYRYSFEFDFDWDIIIFLRYLKEMYGYRRVTFIEKMWRISDIEIIQKIIEEYPKIEIDKVIEGKLEYRKQQEQFDKGEKTKQQMEKAEAIDLSGINGELYPYQKVGVKFLVDSDGKAILSDLMGLGKSIQSLAYIVHEKVKKTLVICPASVKGSWKNEILKWTELKPFVIDSKDGITPKDFNKHDVFIVNYDILKKYIDLLVSLRFEAMIVDECHMIKSPKAIRSKAVNLIAKNISKRILLSGTPMLSRPVELFNSLQLVDPKTWNDYWSYTKRYCSAFQSKWGWDVSGASNIDELKERISGYFLRRTKEEVLPWLPKKQHIDLPVDISNIKEYKKALYSFVDYLREVKKKTTPEIKKTLQAEKLARLGELRKLITSGKIQVATEVINNIVESGEKLLVFSCYNEPLEYFKKKFGDKAVMITGKTKVEERGDIVDSFQNNKDVRVFLGGVHSAGVGITLTAASSVLFIDYDWVPANMDQCEDRCHRIGQEVENIKIYQLYAENTIDSYIRDMLAEKREIFDKLIGGESSRQSVVGDLLKKIEKDI